MFLITVILFFLTILLYFYVKIELIYRTWKRLGVKYAQPAPFVGNFGQVMIAKKHMATVYDDMYKGYPDEPYVGHYEFGNPALLIRDPNIAHRIMVQDFHAFNHRGVRLDGEDDPFMHSLIFLPGERWKITRAKLAPAFSSGNLKHMFPLMLNCLHDMENHLEAEIGGGDHKVVDVRDEVAKYSIDVIGHCALGIQCNTLADPRSEFRIVCKKLFEFSFRTFFKFFCKPIYNNLLPILAFFKMNVWVHPPIVYRFFNKILKEASDNRKDNPDAERRCDFLQLMLDIRDNDLKNHVKDEEAFNDMLFVSNMFLFFSAGFETTTSTMGHCIYELAIHQEIQQKVRDEIKSIIPEFESVREKLTYANIKLFKYLDLVIAETLRKYPPVSIIDRESDMDYVFQETGLKIKKGTQIIIPTYSLQHDPQYFPEPEKFIPERFQDMDKSNALYLPFGIGPRQCLGMRFAKAEMKACIVTLLSKYSFSVCQQTDIPLKLDPKAGLFLAPLNGIPVTISRLQE